MEKLITIKEILKALYTCASKEERGLAIAGFFILPDRRVYSTDGRRLVVIKHGSFDKLEPGNYEFHGKPIYSKNFGEIVIAKGENNGPNIDLVLKDTDKEEICGFMSCTKAQEIPLNLSCLLACIFNSYKTGINYALLDFLPAGECFKLTVKDRTIPDGPVRFNLVKNSGLEFFAIVMSIRWNRN